ncbi:MAG: hypothetical protein GC157_05970 [Frankiales bacterium]|nr:hypothetical protein [Frankiales bacterium]
MTSDPAGASPGDPAAPPVPAWRRQTQGEQRWPASVAVVLVIVLQLTLPGELTTAGHFVLPAVEVVLATVLVSANPLRITRRRPFLRAVSLALIGVASLVNGWSLVLLVRAVLDGSIGSAQELLLTGGNIWITNIVIFALWYWELDRGGPGSRATGEDPDPDFLFPQMADTTGAFHHWEPEFVDYAYVSFTNASAFSPTDTMPLSRWAKMAMMLQASVSLLTAVLIVARAVNLLP